jgi:sulfite reductase (NADPH) flavoprotein alpha-component
MLDNLPSLPDTAPFSSVQRAWLDGWLAGFCAAPASAAIASTTPVSPEPPTADDRPWHVMTLPLGERLVLAEGRPLPQRLMAAMAQQDCGQCGYLC